MLTFHIGDSVLFLGNEWEVIDILPSQRFPYRIQKKNTNIVTIASEVQLAPFIKDIKFPDET